jgi:tRNA/tmRNA/rRNA uracil-C5-methylase (TrmA/RlmC/RlmD family)
MVSVHLELTVGPVGHGGSYCRADAVAVLEPAAGRVPPPCPVSRPGGCDFQHVDPWGQRQLKAQVGVDQLRRIAGLDVEVTVQELPGGPLGWRTRTRLAVDGTGEPDFRVYRSHTVLPVPACPLAVPGSLNPVFSRRWRDLAQVRCATGRVQWALARLPGPPDVVLLDPPRRGAGREVATAVADRGPTRIVHVA